MQRSQQWRKEMRLRRRAAKAEGGEAEAGEEGGTESETTEQWRERRLRKERERQRWKRLQERRPGRFAMVFIRSVGIAATGDGGKQDRTA